MPISYESVVTLGLSILFTAIPVHAGWYYDESCADHTAILNAGMQSATSMVSDAVKGFGSAAPAGSGNIWSFPNTEARDLAGRIFGAPDASASHYNIIKNGFTYITQNYGIGGAPTTGRETRGDMVFYCDLSRLEEQKADSERKVVYKNKNNPQETWTKDDYDKCNFTSVSIATFRTTSMAVTDLGGADYAIMQICPWYLKQMETAHIATTKTIPVRNWWYNALTSASNLWTNINFLTGSKVKPIDLIALFDVTLVHELTHAIQPNNLPSTDPTQRYATYDGDMGFGDTSDGYGWVKIYDIRNSFGFESADSWAYFALGIQQMQNGNRINSDGSVGAIQGGAVSLPQNNNQNNPITVGSTWAPTKRFQPRDQSHRQNLRSVAREMRRSASETAPFSVPGRNSSISAFSGMAPGTGISTRVFTPISGSQNSTSSAGGSTASLTSSQPVFVNSTISRSVTTPSTGSSTSQSLSASSNSVSPPASSTGSSTSSTGSATGQQSSLPSSSLSVSGNSTSQQFTTTNIISSLGSSTTTIVTSVPISITSSSSSSLAAASDISYMFSPTVTEPATATWTIPIIDPAYTPTTSTEAILSIASATDLYIPSISNLAAFPTIKLKDPDPKSKDKTIVPFVKITLPKDKCSPIPKPSGGGLLGLAFHVASDVVNGVIDAACHLVFPVLHGIDPPPPGSVLPPWVSLDIFPPEGDFPEDSEDHTSTASQSSATSTSESSSSSPSSCSASAVPKCTASCAISSISGTATSSCTTVCATVTACSTAASTTTVSSSASGSANSVIDHVGPSSTAWFGTQQDILASLISAAPSTLPTDYFSTASTDPVNSTSSGTITSSTASSTASTSQTPVSSSSKPSNIPPFVPFPIISAPWSKNTVSFTSSPIVTSSVKPTSTPGPSITTAVSPSATLCNGNQVEKNCEGGVLPSATPYSGNITPQCDVADGDKGTLPRINATRASDAVNKYCSSLVNQKTVISATSSAPKADIVDGATENNGKLALTIIYDVNYCPSDKSTSEIDFGKLSYDECYMNLYTAISEVCAQDSTWGDYNKDYTIEGGVYGADCGIWAMTSQT